MKKRKKKRKFNVNARKKDLHILWSSKVRQRDKYVCMWCEYDGRRNVNLKNHAHHIVAVAVCSNIGRFEIDNGVTLCFHCHIDRLKAYPDEYIRFRDSWLQETLAMDYASLRRSYLPFQKFTEEFYAKKKKLLS